MTEGIFILLGSNLGDRKGNLGRAILGISNSIGLVVKQSSIYETAAWGKMDQPSFYNQVIEIHSELSPEQLLQSALRIEKELGRIREEKWGARVIDIDILYIADQVIRISELEVPHPGIPTRRFTLIPIVEIAQDFVHPILKQTNKALLDNCIDDLEVKRLLD